MVWVEAVLEWEAEPGFLLSLERGGALSAPEPAASRGGSLPKSRQPRPRTLATPPTGSHVERPAPSH